MPLQNRVDPYGAIIRTPARGTMMGNRGGALHNEAREIIRQYKSRRWITCVLEFRGRHRTVMSPNRYTELFFLDEAVAFAAGHRPCAECRRERFNAFKDAWGSRDARADDIDLELHRRRTEKARRQVVLGSLPDGCFVEIDGSPWLVWNGGLFLWTPERYVEKRHPIDDADAVLLTPPPVVECFRRGYRPQPHPSALD